MQDSSKISFNEGEYEVVLVPPSENEKEFDDIWVVLCGYCAKGGIFESPVQVGCTALSYDLSGKPMLRDHQLPSSELRQGTHLPGREIPIPLNILFIHVKVRAMDIELADFAK